MRLGPRPHAIAGVQHKLSPAPRRGPMHVQHAPRPGRCCWPGNALCGRLLGSLGTARGREGGRVAEGEVEAQSRPAGTGRAFGGAVEPAWPACGFPAGLRGRGQPRTLTGAGQQSPFQRGPGQAALGHKSRSFAHSRTVPQCAHALRNCSTTGLEDSASVQGIPGHVTPAPHAPCRPFARHSVAAGQGHARSHKGNVEFLVGKRRPWGISGLRPPDTLPVPRCPLSCPAREQGCPYIYCTAAWPCSGRRQGTCASHLECLDGLLV